MDDQVVVDFGDANVAIVALNGDEFAVLGGANGIDERTEVDVIDVGIVDFHLAVVETILVHRRQNFFGQFQGDVDANGFALGVGADDTDMPPAVFGRRSR